MHRMCIVVLSAVLAASFCYGQDSTSAPAQTRPAAVDHGAFPVKVIRTLDSSKLKVGDGIEFETAGSFKLPDGTLVPKGSKLEGHLIAAEARSKGDPRSLLTIAFDKLDISNGESLSIKGTVQAVFPRQEESTPLMAGKASGAAGGAYSGPTVGTVTDDKPRTTVESSGEIADPKSVGVHGLGNLQLEDGVLSSQGKNVKLGDGVRLIVRVDILE